MSPMTTNPKLKEFSYLAIVPRGLQNEISSGLQNQAKALVAAATNDNGRDEEFLKIVTWNDKEENETIQEALRDYSIQKREKEERQKSHPVKPTPKHQPNRIKQEEDISSEWLPPNCVVGSVKLLSSQQHISLGYYQTKGTGDEDKESKGDFLPCMTSIGQLTGCAWMQLETDRRDIGLQIVAPSRMLGPLLALVSVQTDNSCLQAMSTSIEINDTGTISRQDVYRRYHQHSLEDMIQETTRHIRSNPDAFSERVDRALNVWKDCVETRWKDRLSPSEYSDLQSRIRENRLRFRISCVRVEPVFVCSSYSKKRKKKSSTSRELFNYSRQELCLAIMDSCGPQLVPGFYEESSKEATRSHNNLRSCTQGSGSWSVNLEKFDVELVIFITPPDIRSKYGKLAFGISLCPYSFLQSKSFSSGTVPPDVTFPYLGGDILSQGIVRLRPTTAHLLLQIANLQKYDIVVDPCAGVGTIPVEAEWYHKILGSPHPHELGESNQVLSIGGDLILNNPKYTKVAGVMENYCRRNTTTDINKGLQCSSLMVAWDAAHLPMRTSSVDVVVSDLPFGQQCLSASALSQLLPLIFLECARILTPSTGRMVVLAGGSPIPLIASIGKLSGKYWKKPIQRVSPVSIGGLLAWIVRIDRNELAFDHSNTVENIPFVRKIAEKRDRISRQRKTASGEQTGRRRRNLNG